LGLDLVGRLRALHPGQVEQILRILPKDKTRRVITLNHLGHYLFEKIDVFLFFQQDYAMQALPMVEVIQEEGMNNHRQPGALLLKLLQELRFGKIKDLWVQEQQVRGIVVGNHPQDFLAIPSHHHLVARIRQLPPEKLPHAPIPICDQNFEGVTHSGHLGRVLTGNSATDVPSG
jgi:hypothetical protein